MCRNIRILFNLKPPVTDEEIHSAARQYVRKVSGATKPSRANGPAFERAVEQVARATRELLDELVTRAPGRDRAVEAEKGKLRAARRTLYKPIGDHGSGHAP